MVFRYKTWELASIRYAILSVYFLLFSISFLIHHLFIFIRSHTISQDAESIPSKQPLMDAILLEVLSPRKYNCFINTLLSTRKG